MKVLHVVRRLDATLGGAPAAAAHLAVALASEGHEVTIATTVPRGGSRQEIEQLAAMMGDSVVVESFERSGLPYNHSHGLGRWLSRSATRFDVIETHGVFDYPCWKAADTAHRRRRPLLIHAHGSLDPFDLRKHAAMKRLIGPTAVRRALDHASAIMVTTEREGAALQRFGSRTMIRSIPLPYRPSQCRGDGDRFRAVHNIPSGPVLLFLGRMDYKKGLQHLVNAAAILRQQEVKLTFVLAGDASTDYGEALKADARARGLEMAVVFPGHLDEGEKADGLAAATAFALVSDNENYGLVLVEAARAALPMILSDQVYLAEQLREAGAASIVTRDGAAVARIINSLISDPPQLERMSAAALRASTDLFDWKVVARAQSEFRSAVVDHYRLPVAR